MATSRRTDNNGDLFFLLLLAITLVVLSLFYGCSPGAQVLKQTREDSVVISHSTTDTHGLLVSVSDSVYARDSVYEYLMFRNDTVTHYLYKFRTEYRERPTTVYEYKTLTDTLIMYEHERDSIPVQVEVVKEKKLNLWQRQKLCFGGYAELLILLEILAVLFYFYRKRRG